MPQIRDTIKRLSPPWLARAAGEKFLYTAGLCIDGLIEKLNQGVLARMPGVGTPTALPILAQDRNIIQGPNETVLSFQGRLRSVFEAWQRAGSRRAIFSQITAFFTPVTTLGKLPNAAIVSSVGATPTDALWDVFYSDQANLDAPFHLRIANQWNWDNIFQWWRAWLILYAYLVTTGNTGTTVGYNSIDNSFSAGTAFVKLVGLSGVTADMQYAYIGIAGAASGANNGVFQIVKVNSATSVTIANQNAVIPDANNGAISYGIFKYQPVGPGPVWGSPTVWGDTTISWGLNTSADYVRTIRTILNTWKSAGTFYPWIIFAFSSGPGDSGSALSPYTLTFDKPMGDWGEWAKTVDGIVVPARTVGLGEVRFADGTGIYSPGSTIQDLT